MTRKLKSISLLIYIILALFFYEIILRLAVTKSLSFSHLFYSLAFSISFALIIYTISTIFNEKVGFILVFVFALISAFLFASQLIYYKFFRTFYTIYSASKGGQVFGFWKDILMVLKKNWIWLILLFLPSLLFFFLKNRLFFFKKSRFRRVLALLGVLIVLNASILAALFFGDRQLNSPHDLYFKSSNPLLSTQELGLLTSMRLDAQRSLFQKGPSIPSFAPSVNKGEDNDRENNETQESHRPIISDDPLESIEEQIDEAPQGPNIMEIDFDQLISTEGDDVLKDMHLYFRNVQPTLKNDYTGKYEGYNLILITAESFSPYAVDKDITPTLYKMVNEGYNFTNFYTPIWEVSTLDGEYVACTGLLPKREVWSFYKSGNISLPFVMGNQFKNLQGRAVAYHNHTYDYYKRDVSHPNMGYDYKGIGNGLNMAKAWPRSDLEMMEITIPEYIDDDPFHAYYMTVSGHMQYNFSGNHMAIKNKELVEGLPYTEAGKAYIATQIELDKAMEYLLEQLDQKGIADKTLIAMSADHYPYGLEDNELNDLAGHDIEKNFELYKNIFVVYTKGMDPEVIDKPCSSLDIIPTLSNLLGLEYDSRLLMGTDIFSDSQPLVIFLNRSFITEKGKYDALKQDFLPFNGEHIDESYIENVLDIIEK
ncbi:MAG TPA: LTA synthase family protein, partial [Clostridia bacterium]|nr:LTA synthase family protein [Clostridia bacterium]